MNFVLRHRCLGGIRKGDGQRGAIPGAVLEGRGGGGFATFGGRPRRVVAKGGWRLQGAMAVLRVVLDPGQLSPCALAEVDD